MVEDFCPCPHGVWMRTDVTCVLPGMASMVLALELLGFSAGRPEGP